MVDKVALGMFSPSISASPANSHSALLKVGTIGQIVANVPHGLFLIPPQQIKN
jgi:hypothetical protein